MADIVRIHKRQPKPVGIGGEARIMLADALRTTANIAAAVIVVLGKDGKFSLRVAYDAGKIDRIDAHLRAEKVIAHTTSKMLDGDL